MKRKEGYQYMLRAIGKLYMIVPIERETICLKEIMIVNETGAYLWGLLEKEVSEEELLNAVLLEYNIDRKTAKEDIEEFLKRAETIGIVS